MWNLVFSIHRQKLLTRYRRYLGAYLFIAPLLLSFMGFRMYPALQTLRYAFFQVELLKQKITWIGFGNFLDLLEDEIFLRSFTNTLKYCLYMVPASTVVGLVLASLLGAKIRVNSFFKAVYFSPYITSTVAAAMIWWWLYNPQFGLFNAVLRLLHLPPQPWLTSSKQALMAVIIFSVWKIVGYNIVVFVAGLQAIPSVYYEAARIDGAGSFTAFFRITLPLLVPTTAFILIYNTILAFQVFDQVFILTGGGPAHASTVMVLEIYQQAFLKYRFGYAAAMATVLFVCILGVTIVQYALSERQEVVY
ncbi:MAG: carbohydrate ABC transporter permease [Candidatus Caldatribacteriaceae bacterium]